MGHMGPAFRRQIVMFGLIVALVMAALPAPASAGHSWNNYHWGRTGNPFTVQLGNNLGGTWVDYLWVASNDWTQSAALDTVVVGGNGSCETPRSGYVDVCNGYYGEVGWLGVAQIWIGGGHIVQGVAKMNDTYFDTAYYDTPAWRQFVMCQEIGHTFGLGHTDETFGNANQGTCMDYTNDPDGTKSGQLSNERPNQHDYDQLTKIYRHKDRTTTVANASSAAEAGLSRAAVAVPSGPEQGGVSVFVTPVEGGEVVTFVIWADANLIAAANANPNAPVADTTTGTDQEGYPVGEGEHVHEAVAVDTDGDGLTDDEEVAAGTDPLTAEVAVVTSDGSFAEGSTVVTIDTVNLRAAPSRQGDILGELPAGTTLAVTGPAQQAQGLSWVPVTTTEGVFGYVAADFIAPAGSGS